MVCLEAPQSTLRLLHHLPSVCLTEVLEETVWKLSRLNAL